ncbi:putative membrane protein [Halobacteriovorax marinus SJ]|uniref:Membrane protein n=1 Tax=Halobacteriovorax marinus (strain ATCC BAA-682 / DSM 15412 / SJ) TaxID=862908 RepID=E1X5P8_HALMS|nr:hypothetical protein [Halobacteriovorax marinus]CBW25615.1 putative membrane protein [Halobacteriovorax marinus SJ]
MKRNLGLLAALIVLLGITYFTQERRGILKEQEKDNYSKILDTSKYGDLVEIQTPFGHIKKFNDGFINFTDGHRANQKVVNEFLTRLSHIRSKKFLKDISKEKMKEFFPEDHMKMTFTFENEVLEYQLGAKLNFSQDFYVAMRTKSSGLVVAIANDKMPFEGVVSKENEHRSDHKYNRVKALFNLAPNFFLDLSIFEEEELERSIVFSNLANESFAIDFKAQTTNPPPEHPIIVSKAKMSHLRERLLSLRAFNYLSNVDDTTNFSRKVGTIKTSEGLYTIYERYKGDQSYYIFNPKNNIYYQFKAGEQKLLLFNIQNVWDLRVVEELGSKIKITFDNNETLELEVHKIGEEASKLFKILLSPAQYVEKVKDFSKYKNWKLKLIINSRELEVLFTESEMLVLDRKQKLTYHYTRFSKEPISVDPDKYRVK